MKDVGEDVLGRQKGKKKEWLSNESWKLTEEKKAINKRL